MLPLSGEVLALLRGWVAAEGLEPHDSVFGIANTTIDRTWCQIRKEAQVEDCRWHDLRHTYAVYCAKAGMPLPELQQRLGHASIEQTMIYAIYQPPTASVHYNRALEAMGMAGEIPTFIPTVGAVTGQLVGIEPSCGTPRL